MIDAPKPKRRWYQYSLRTLLIFVTLSAIPCSWFAVKMQQARRQRAAVEAIRKLKGIVVYDHEYDREATYSGPPGPTWLRKLVGDDFFASVLEVLIDELPATHAPMPHLKELPGLQHLSLSGWHVTDASLENVEGLTQLLELHLDTTQVTDAGLERLSGLTRLRAFDLTASFSVTDAGLRHLTGMSQIVTLSLSNNRITDAGLEHLKGMTQLRWLFLDRTHITDAGLIHLEGLTQLRELSLVHTHVTDKGVKKLQQALPKCRITRGFAEAG